MNIIFLGPPGSGKGTYASRICARLGIPHISTGDLFREEVKKETALGKKAGDYMKKGLLVPDSIVIGMLEKRLQQKDSRKGFILDGFPRTIEQAGALEAIFRIESVINLVLPDSIIIQKISARRVCGNCGDIYNIADIRFGKNNEYRMPSQLPKKEGICDKCGGALMQRKDDMVNVVEERLKVYKKQTEPLIDYYKKKGILNNVDVTGPPEIMVPKILKVLGQTV